VGKLVLVGALLVAFLAYALHPHGASAAKVASCLEKRGATVSRSRFFEDVLGTTGDGQQLPESMQRELQDIDRHLYDVTIAEDSGWLMDTKQAHQEARMEAAAAAQGIDITAQGHGTVVMLWSGGPSSASRAALDRCL